MSVMAVVAMTAVTAVVTVTRGPFPREVVAREAGDA